METAMKFCAEPFASELRDGLCREIAREHFELRRHIELQTGCSLIEAWFEAWTIMMEEEGVGRKA